MAEVNQDPMTVKLRELGKRIHARIAEMREHGVFSDARAAFLKGAEDRCTEVDSKLEKAVAQGGAWEAAALELERDYDGLLLELARWLERHDENAMKTSQ
jgi:hypothetical protein